MSLNLYSNAPYMFHIDQKIYLSAYLSKWLTTIATILRPDLM